MCRHAPSPLWPPLLLTALLLCATAGGCRHGASAAKEPEPEAPVQAQAARTITLGQWTELVGTTQPLPNHSARISAAVEGHVLSVLDDGKGARVVEGQHVQVGQVIVRLDDSVLRANRDKLQATVHDLEEQQKQAGYAHELATIDVNRLKELLKGSSASTPLPLVSRVELEKAQVLQQDAQSKQKAVAARQAATRADLKALEKQMEFFTLRAPIAGRLGIVQAVPGQTLTPGTVVADVLDLDSIDVVCYVPPDAVARLAPEQTARLITEKVGTQEAGQPLEGKVAFVGVQAQPETGNVPVKVRFPNPELRLRANTIVRVQVLTLPERERLTIPEAALMEDLDVPAVLVVEHVKTEKHGNDEKTLGKVRRLRAVLGIRDRDHGVVELLGLDDEHVSPREALFVTAGGHGLHDDDVVKLQKDEHKDDAPEVEAADDRDGTLCVMHATPMTDRAEPAAWIDFAMPANRGLLLLTLEAAFQTADDVSLDDLS